MDLQVLNPNGDEKLNLNRQLHVLRKSIPRNHPQSGKMVIEEKLGIMH